jgi:hypothetical protein
MIFSQKRCFPVTDFLTYIGSWSALQWVLLVLAAGFIGQFGRMLADAIIARVRLNRSGQRAGVEDGTLRRESSAPPVASSQGPPALPAVTGDIPDKKALKIVAKARKKEAKKN